MYKKHIKCYEGGKGFRSLSIVFNPLLLEPCHAATIQGFVVQSSETIRSKVHMLTKVPR